jgi:diketogulonate reductase-like aldo/keto reductase
MHHGYEATLKSIQDSIQLLNSEYIDLFLIHWPGFKGIPVANHVENKTLRLESWRALVDAYRMKYVRSIGVSNYNVSHLMEIEAFTPDCLPMINQIEVHPAWYPIHDILYCRQRNIQIQGYSVFGRSKPIDDNGTLFSNPTLRSISNELRITVAQVCLLYCLGLHIAVIPKSINSDRIIENWNVKNISSVLSEEHYDRIRNEIRPLKVCWDPKIVK